MHKLLTFLKMQNPRREGQGHAGGWLEARVWTRCHAKDPLDASAVTSFVQARFLSIVRALCTTLALGAVAFGVCSPAAADSCSMAFGRQGGTGCNSVIASAPPAGPPVFTFRDIQISSASGNIATSNAMAIGAPSSTRRVYTVITNGDAGSTATSASFNSGAIAADVFQVIGTVGPPTTGGDSFNVYLVSAVIPTGTTATVSLTYPSTLFAAPICAAYTVDTTTLSGINPVTTAQSYVASGTVLPAASNTFGVPVATAGSAILAGFIGFGITNGSQSITSSDASFTTGSLFSSTLTAVANSAPVSSSSRVNIGWTTSGQGFLALAVLR
jgi:hypothetical protein